MRRLRAGIFGRGTAPTDGGSDTLLATLTEQLGRRSAGNDVELVSVPWRAWSHRRRPFRYFWSRVVRRLGGEIPLVDLRPVCRRWRLDLAYFAAPAFVRLDLPYIYSVWDLGHRTIPEFPEMRCGGDPWSQREAQYRQMLGQASYVVVGNSCGAAEIREHYGIPEHRLIALPFPNPDFSGVTERVPHWLPAEPYLLYPAQGWPHKNHMTLLRALAELSSRGVRVPTLVFVGSDKGNVRYLRACSNELGMDRHVRFGGFVSRGELMALYRRATALVFPSLLGPNNLPPQEAALLECPMILSDLPGHREQLKQGALYVPPLDHHAWAEVILRLISDPALRSQLVSKARAAVDGYTAEAYAGRIAGLIADMARVRRLWA